MPDFSQLTERQREIYDFIKSKIDSRGYGPTVREIGLAFEIRSPNGVMCHLKALEKKGLILREGFSARAIQLVGHRPPSASFTSAAMRASIPLASNRVMGPTPDFPASIACQFFSTPVPSAVMSPVPVMTTRRFMALTRSWQTAGV